MRHVNRDETWRDLAACKSNVDVMFPIPRRGIPDRVAYKDARAICASCTVRTACLKYALDNEIPDGMWGGLTPTERTTTSTTQEITA